MTEKTQKKKATKSSLEKRYAELEKKMANPKYAMQAYKNDAEVVIRGALFADFVNTQANNQKMLAQMHQNLSASLKVVEFLMNGNEGLTLQLMEQHLKNIDNGATYTVSEEELKKEENAGTIEK